MTKANVQTTSFGATVTFSDGSTMNFQKNENGQWDYADSRDMFDDLESAIDDYITYLTEA
jgi:hypothetical protein